MSRTRSRRASRPAPAFGRLAIMLAVASGLRTAANVSAHPGMHETIERLTLEIEASPDEQRLYVERGNAYSNEGKLGDALADFRRAKSLGDPDLVAFDLGVLFYRAGDYATARAALSRSLVRFPNDPRALDYRARAAREAGDARAALSDFDALFALRADTNPGHYLSAAELLATQGADGLAAALALLDRGMRQLGVIPQLQQRAIAYERERGRLGDALLRHDALGEKLARSPEWRAERAELLLALGRRDEAARELGDAAIALASLRQTRARAEMAERIELLWRRAVDPSEGR